MVDAAILQVNAETLERFEKLLAGLSDADLQRDLGDGWNVAVALAHMAFWDRRAVAVLERWARDGTPYRDQDDDIINAALLAELQALPPRTTVELARSAARAVNAAVESLPDAVWQELAGRPEVGLIRRANHRGEHLEQLEAALGSG